MILRHPFGLGSVFVICNSNCEGSVESKYKQEFKDASALADRILNQNEYITLAHTIKAREAYRNGDFISLIERKNLIFEMFPFQYADTYN